MKYAAYGLTQNETVIFLHGGGLAPWNYCDIAEQLQDRFHIIIPILDGHSGSDTDFTTIENNADEIIHYVDESFCGKIFMICGLSLGGQILTEILAKRKDICKYAIIESTLVIPMKIIYAFIQPIISICYPLIKKHWFARLQFKTLHIKESLFEDYYKDSTAISKENMIAFLKANSDYKLKESVKQSLTKVLILVGSKESRIMKKSAEILCEQIPNAALEVLPGYYHGDLSINHASEYIQKIDDLILMSKAMKQR